MDPEVEEVQEAEVVSVTAVEVEEVDPQNEVEDHQELVDPQRGRDLKIKVANQPMAMHLHHLGNY